MKYFRIKHEGMYSYFFNAIDVVYKVNIFKEDKGFVLYDVILSEPGSRCFSPVLRTEVWYPQLKIAKNYARAVIYSNEERRRRQPEKTNESDTN